MKFSWSAYNWICHFSRVIILHMLPWSIKGKQYLKISNQFVHQGVFMGVWNMLEVLREWEKHLHNQIKKATTEMKPKICLLCRTIVNALSHEDVLVNIENFLFVCGKSNLHSNLKCTCTLMLFSRKPNSGSAWVCITSHSLSKIC